MELIDKSRQFLSEANQELKRVTWPARKHIAASTWVVIGLVLLIGVFFGVVDFVFSKLIRIVLG
ncbi:MAG: preprotein translocase subunit SecE [Deltaproteobacteria bacterium RIFCSPLOWO2_12_FULL_43_16]|nr:MAG: preprotein translocase subunit SecE [Deltaproteobacteria bacterium GWA2_43_19]OGQ09884.1 MAG: preprotein translocase subunit SecE [Deltaproteobacteria bacterium RIFCSPHIGHO2_02_FULL_43_33]OGQ35007.1 MAG: preprotein translocase subunit SecE [Deltaproteobacteria bacterium RIFCSPLOWO2_01_FULL_42_9]OGQ60914.1 MAG: preprotein translocase subunit SecE [Deltaproteobacteria bacterium RIFCSPLOWO2_12_FULL_43_16]HBR17056.1 preprotein translocase subunit SecE [Deltaproteobacteria bacterium]